ncbi:hypothetical protein LUX05_19780 [Streptomyces somaliensis]|nr:hypothetical protein [Streptomyces somaliensis]
MPSCSTSLSLVPKWRIAQSLTAAGVASMDAPPTAMTGLDCGRTAAATSSATDSDAKPASTPLSAPSARRGHPGRTR